MKEQKRVHEAIGQIVRRHVPRAERAKALAGFIRQLGGYRWVGLYDISATEATILAWSGGAEPAHPRFPLKLGITGQAVTTRTTVIVADVRVESAYLETSASTRSEMVVPIRSSLNGTVLGTIDVDSPDTDAFGMTDRTLLEEIAAAVAPLWEQLVQRDE